MLLIANLFGLAPSVTMTQSTLRDIARGISRDGRPYLCLLDSVELLGGETVQSLRSYLSQIYDLVRRAGSIDVRLALVAASRQQAEWQGAVPEPRPATLPLTEFKVEVVRQALDDLAQQSRRSFLLSESRQNALRIHRLTEGLPALLPQCIQWVQDEEWLEMDRLESQQIFEELARPYIEQDLLSVDSLLPCGSRNPDVEQGALAEALRVLVPYRLFTQAHLRHHHQSDTALQQALGRVGWTIEDLWRAIGQTTLLSRPLHEPWQAVYAPIRRLLYRYYWSDEKRADAHRRARKFIEIWADKMAGAEQVACLVECLWHDAAMLSLEHSAELETELTESARNLSRALQESPAYTVAELREYAAVRIANDDELQEAVSHVAGLHENLAAVVKTP
jgi:hypothetical protein